MTPDISALPPKMQTKIRLEICLVPGLDPACWVWVAALTSAGYGSFQYAGRRMSTHRLTYELLVGPIPDGLQIDHLCRNRPCCNPAHLEPVTTRINVLRARARESCVRGHEYTPENTIYKKKGTQRNCRACANEWQREYRAARKAEQFPPTAPELLDGLIVDSAVA